MKGLINARRGLLGTEPEKLQVVKNLVKGGKIADVDAKKSQVS